MIKSGFLKRALGLILAAALVLPNASAAYADKKVLSDSRNKNKANIAVMSDELKRALKNKDEIFDVMVRMKEDADLNQAKKDARSFDTDEPLYLKEKNAIVGEMKEIAAETQQDLIAYLEKEKEKGNVKEFKSFFIVNAIHVKAKKSVIERLSRSSKVEKIEPNGKIYLEEPVEIEEKDNDRSKAGDSMSFGLMRSYAPPKDEVEWNIKKINADKVWTDYGITGEGVTVGIMDSAVDYDHPALKNKFKGYDKNTDSYHFDGSYKDAVDGRERPAPSDDMEHGSHCAGIILGSEEVNGEVYNQIGVAPDAKWINARVFGNDEHSATTDGFLTAAEWFLQPGGRTDNAPDIINNSWGANGPLSNKSTYFKEAVASWRKAGILPVFAAGNQGRGESAPGAGSISNPGNLADSFAVGAVDENGNLAPFSKQGPSGIPGVSEIKPEVSAPGVHIRSAVTNKYGYMNGTSMAAPHVSGLAALLKSADKNLTPEQIERYIMSTAENRTNGIYTTAPNHGFGHGIVNAYDAVSKLKGKAGVLLKGKITSKGDVAVPASITIVETNRTVTANSVTGEYSLFHTAGEWTIKVYAKGFDPVEEKIKLSDENQNKDFVLMPKNLGGIKGVVTDNGQPVEGVNIRLLEDADVEMIQTNNKGEYTLKNIYSGKYTIRAFKDGYENKEIEVTLKDGNTIECSIEIEKEKLDDLVKKDEGEGAAGDPAFFMADNFIVDGMLNGGAALRVVPSRENGIISSISINFHRGGTTAPGTKAILHIVELDNRGRTKFLLKDKKINFKPGEVKTVSLGAEQIKTGKPFFIVVTKEKADSSYCVGINDNGGSNSSFIWQDFNLIPFEHTNDKRGALKMSATMRYPKNADEIKISVTKPEVFPVKVQALEVNGILEEGGKALSNRTIAITLPNGNKRMTVTNSEGRFNIKVSNGLMPGAVVSVSSRDLNGMASDEVEQVVRNSYLDLESVISFTEKTLQKIENNDIKTKMTALLDNGKGFVEKAKELERKETVESKEIKDLQNKIDENYNAVKLLAAEIYPKKKALWLAIEEIQREFDETLISYHGNDVPTNKYWVGQAEWSNMRSAIINARVVYDKYEASDDEIQKAEKRLNDAKISFRANKKLGKKPVIVIDNKYEDGRREGEGRGTGLLANHVIIEVKGGKLISVNISTWYDSQAARDAIENGFIDSIISANSLDVPLIRGYERECSSVIEAIKQALEKLLKQGYLPEVDKSDLLRLINEAEDQLNAVKISAKGDGSDIAAGVKWVTKDEYDSFSNAIGVAKTAYNDRKIAEDAVRKARMELTIETAKFKGYIKTGVNSSGGSDIKEYKGRETVQGGGIITPYELILKVRIRDNKIVEITDLETVPSKGSSTFHNKALTELKEKLLGLNAKENPELNGIHAVSGATISSKAVKAVVSRALKEHNDSYNNTGSFESAINEAIFNAKYELYITKKSVNGSDVAANHKWIDRSAKQRFINKIKDVIKQVNGTMNEAKYKELKEQIDKALKELETSKKFGRK